jgi:hypothetical protein
MRPRARGAVLCGAAPAGISIIFYSTVNGDCPGCMEDHLYKLQTQTVVGAGLAPAVPVAV